MSVKRLQADGAACKPALQKPKVRDQNYEYLADSSQKDARWDPLKVNSRRMAAALVDAEDLKPRAQRMHGCSDILTFALQVLRKTGEIRFKLEHGSFCRDRMCETDQMLKSRTWQKQFRAVAPALIEKHPGAHWLVLTLTIRNPDIYQTRAALGEMNKAWARLIRRKEFRDVLGWIRATEITRGGASSHGARFKNHRQKPRVVDNTSHPHFHVLMMVSSQYFKTRYISQAKWLKAWQECVRDDAITQVDIRALKPRKGHSEDPEGDGLGWLMAGALEVLKYTSKAVDLLPAKEPKHAGPGVLDSVLWVQELARQIRALRFMMTGGVLKDALKDLDHLTDAELIHAADDEVAEDEEEVQKLSFGFSGEVKRYRRKR